ncbi:FAD-dependent oxidoreductase [Salinadaptatus halalkaliphilus]|uniref:FAD-dependent oxidoreductase n=1 Tax=Salinadaptatus halalkaliphilus TaxID=2419781 RepID=A0A4S3TLT2_9EURY|nr:NAD(P)/FAD-dependent oxidoreductase [Salinadaptatus halalkaliphilus]THE65036.1 FAD-dependent oxidoreductase [Salinadaptatus halalkaliphilus]
MTETQFDVAVVGGGVAGMSTAARLQADGYSTLVLEQHDHVGGCAGYYRQDGFAFDVGATTLVDFRDGGVGGQLLEAIDFEPPAIDVQDAYKLWLPDRRATLYRDQQRWDRERRATFGDDERHLAFYQFVDDLSATLWRLTRRDVALPIQSVADLVRNLRAVGLRDLPIVRYRRSTMADAMRKFGVYDDTALRHGLAMLVEDTVHATLEEAPLFNAVLGTTIRRAGLGRATGGMYGFWTAFADHYADLGGVLETDRTVTEVIGLAGDFRLETETDSYRAAQVVSAVPIDLTKRIASGIVGDRLDEHVEMLRDHRGSAVVVFLGVPEAEVADHGITHHQLLASYDEPLGAGNNMFVTVSAADDTRSAPPGHRAVMLSTHCDVEPWQDLASEAYERRKSAIGQRLVSQARTVYPELATDPVVSEVGTPVTYEAFTNRPRGAVGGYRQTLSNTNQHAVPQDIGVDGFYLAGDTTWPGLGTVACVKGSDIAADLVRERGIRYSD